MFFLIFLELYLLDLCVDMAESFSKWLFNRSVWKIFLTCEDGFFREEKKLKCLLNGHSKLGTTRKIKEKVEGCLKFCGLNFRY